MDRGKPSLLLISHARDTELERALGQGGFDVSVLPDSLTAVATLESRLFDAVLLPFDAAVTERAASELTRLRERCPDTPIVAVGVDAREPLHAALAAGAAEYLAWPASAETLQSTLAAAFAHAHAGGLAVSSLLSDSGLLGKSPQMAAVNDTLSRAANGTATVLVRGETGTGKELAARAIHAQSPRRGAPFIKVNTPAVPDALLESELFGYEKGAFTGANMRKPGRVELADGGTLFLDEIGEVSPTMQAKLLRLIQDREYERLGGTRTLRADIRFVAATHRDLEHMVESGTFREDLFYRLNVVTVWLPPLRARREDIAPIVQHYFSRFRDANHKPMLRLADEALVALQSERWPGNVRQLVNLVERMVVLAPGEVISAADVQREMEEQLAFLTQAAPQGLAALTASPAPSSVAPSSVTPPSASSVPVPVAVPTAPPPIHFSSEVRPLKEDLRRAELRAITKALASADGNRSLAARLLGVSRRTLYTKLDEHGIE